MARRNSTTPCKKCGSTERYKSGHCVPCKKKYRTENRDKTREYNQKWNAANPDKRREWSRKWEAENRDRKRELERKWRDANPDKVRESSRRWEAENRDKIREKNRKWEAANPDKRKNLRHRRRANLEGYISDTDWRSLVAHYGCCLACGRSDVALAMDHIVPIAKGGKHDIDNVQPLCQSCNSSKRTKIIDYRPDKGPGFWRQLKLAMLDTGHDWS